MFIKFFIVLKHHEYYIVAKEIILSLEDKFEVSIDKDQICYTTMYLANMNLLDIDFNFEYDLDEDILEEIINETTYFQFHFYVYQMSYSIL